MARSIRIQIRTLRGPRAGEERTESLTFPPDGRLLVGRGPDAALRLDHATVSVSHLAIIHDQGMFWVQDLDSQNGSQLGGTKLKPQLKTPCAPGHILVVGPFLISILDPTLDRPLGDAGSTQSLALEAVLKLLQNSSTETAFLTVLSGPQSGVRVPIPMGRPLLIGRDPGAHLFLSDANVSHKHARVYADAEGVWLEDLHSMHGTWVDGRRISGLWKLATGQAIRLGDTELGFQDPAEQILHDLEAAADQMLQAEAGRMESISLPEQDSSTPQDAQMTPLPEDEVFPPPPAPIDESESATEASQEVLPPAAQTDKSDPIAASQRQASSRLAVQEPSEPKDVSGQFEEPLESASSIWWIAGLAGGITAILAAVGLFVWMLTK